MYCTLKYSNFRIESSSIEAHLLTLQLNKQQNYNKNIRSRTDILFLIIYFLITG